MTQFDEPELAGYVPTEGMPYRRHVRSVMRVVVVVGIGCLILPGVVIAWQTAAYAASVTCGTMARASTATASGSSARFELMGGAGPQWYCYAEVSGQARQIGTLGLIPQQIAG